MSPEQARGAAGRRVDPTSGRSARCCSRCSPAQCAFAGPTPSDVLAGILQRTPDWSALPPTTPAAITRLLKRCLEREPQRSPPRHRRCSPRDRRRGTDTARRGASPIKPARDGATRLVRPTRVMGRDRLTGDAGAGRSISGRREAKTLARKSDSSWRRPQGRDSSACRQSRPMAARSCSRPFPTLAVTSGSGSGRSPPAAATELPGTLGASYPFWSADSRCVGVLCRWAAQTRGRHRRQSRHRLRCRGRPRGAVARRRHDCVCPDAHSAR